MTEPSAAQRLAIRWARIRRWEFWPAWLFYLPILVWIVLLGVRHRHFTAFTAANPGMDEGGVVGERKSVMLEPLRAACPESTPAQLCLPAQRPAKERLRQALAFAADHDYPLVAKPDIGQRGRGVAVLRDPDALRAYVSQADFDLLLQAFVPGAEFGIFVVRAPGSTDISLFSITEKRLLGVTGDGQSCLGELILKDPRGRLNWALLRQTQAAHWHDIVPAGEHRRLVELGSHCRGALFLDAGHLLSEALRTRMQRLTDACPDFHFGRFDIKAPSAQALSAGRDIKVLEVNGVTSEAAHVYHPGTPLLTGYRVFFHQWALAFAIGKANLRRGAQAASPVRLLALFIADLQRHDGAEQVARASRQA